MVTIDVLLTELQMAASFHHEMEARRLPERFFYWFPLCIQAWLDLCSDGAYRNYLRSHRLVESAAEDLAEQVHAPGVEVISLGAGQGDKDAMILRALVAAGKRVRYRPVDASQGLLEIACRAASDAGVPTRGVKANITDPDHLAAALAPGDDPRLVILLGNTLGAFDPVNYLGTLRGLLTERDALLVDGEIYAGDQTVAGYDNPLNRRFAYGPLTSVGIQYEDGDITFTPEEDAAHPGLYRLTKEFRTRRPVTLQLAGRSLALDTGDTIAMSYSGKYSRDRFEALVSDTSSFRALADYTSSDDRFRMALLAPRTGS